MADADELLREMTEKVRSTWNVSPEGRAYLARIDACLAQPKANAPAPGVQAGMVSVPKWLADVGPIKLAVGSITMESRSIGEALHELEYALDSQSVKEGA